MRATEADIFKLQGRLREARVRQSAIQNRIESAQNRMRMREMYAGPKVDEAFSRFELLERQADYAEGCAEALGLAAPRTLDDEFAELRNAGKVEAELEGLKAKQAAEAAEQGRI
jgi:phage shock protein A